jgi:DNA-binding NtrC family response regulator
MARILISEPHDDVRRLLERMVTRLGHEPIAVRTPTPQQLTSADVFMVEPAAPIGAVLAQAAHLIDPSLPLICVSVAAAPPELADLGIVFTDTLVKPFTIEQLCVAIDRALRIPRSHRCARRPQDTDHGAQSA